MIKSMTGFANSTGACEGYTWAWEIRAVNARGMDARLRVPDWIEGLEPALRPIIQKTVARGNVNLTLKVTRDENEQGDAMDTLVLDRVLSGLKQIEDRAKKDHDLKLAPTSAADILAMRGIVDTGRTSQDTAKLLVALKSDFAKLVDALDVMRKNEGASLEKLVEGQLDQIHSLTTKAADIAKSREGATAQNLRENLERVLNNTDGAHPDRVAQELALISIKSDVTEEIDRILAHVSAARELLQTNGPVGRKFDFLSQEFNRETNTLCAKAQANKLTQVGLDLKAVIEQMREQIQNVE